MKDPNLRMVWASDVWSWPKMQGQVIDLDDFDDQANMTDIDCDHWWYSRLQVSGVLKGEAYQEFSTSTPFLKQIDHRSWLEKVSSQSDQYWARYQQNKVKTWLKFLIFLKFLLNILDNSAPFPKFGQDFWDPPYLWDLPHIVNFQPQFPFVIRLSHDPLVSRNLGALPPWVSYYCI